MVPNSLMVRAASALTAVAGGLALANWYTRPESALAWAAALAMLAAMGAALRLSRLIARRVAPEATADRTRDQIATSVVFAALMLGVPLALTLARTYGLVDGFELARRSIGVLGGVVIMMIGNAMPKNLPPLASCDGARQQEFQRLAGWTWVLCGLAMAIGWLVLPIDAAETAAFVLVPTALAVTIVHLVRLARRASTNPPMHRG